MKSLIRALLVATALAPLPGLGQDNPLRRCDNNHFIAPRVLGCIGPEWLEKQKLRYSHGTHTATLLSDGRVLVAGYTSIPEVTAEVYEPAADAWTVTGRMTRDRSGHTATRLLDGRVMVIGGEIRSTAADPYIYVKGTAEFYDPAANAWLAAPSLPEAKGGFTATLLPTGEVLVAGGYSESDDSLASAAIFDPIANRWRSTAPLHTARFWHTATALPDGNVLVVGGWADDWLGLSLPDAELYDWRAGTWKPAGMIRARAGHTATLLANGTVLVAGGYEHGGPPGGSGYLTFETLGSASVFDPATGRWTETADTGSPRFSHLAAPLRDGGVMLAPGRRSLGYVPHLTYEDVRNVMKYSTSTAQWFDLGVPAIELPGPATVTPLLDGGLLFVGQDRAVIFRH